MKIDKAAKLFSYDTSYSQNRELSWLRFNQRVLEEAVDQTVPLFEQLKFVSIFTSNLDEFFMIRVGSLHDVALLKGNHVDNKTGMTASDQLSAIFKAVKPLYEKKDQVYGQVSRRLRYYGIQRLKMEDLAPEEKKFIDRYFKRDVLPVLSPQIVDTHHPFPHLVNKQLHIVATLNAADHKILGIITMPPWLPRIIYLPGSSTRYIFLEDVLEHYTQTVFDMYSLECKAVISVTRNADISPDDETFDMDEDFRRHMQKILKKRSRLAPVRLEHQDALDDFLKTCLMKRLNLSEDQVFYSKSPLDMSYVYGMQDKFPHSIMRDLLYPEFTPCIPEMFLAQESIWKQSQHRDLLLFYPYEDMSEFLRMVHEASEDPSVLSIKIVLYRVAAKSKLMDYLCQAAENGKEVTVLIELRARFDEQNNINWAEYLENAGCKIIYGLEGYKVHSKICLITRQEKGQIRYLTQVGTGNYNEKTAALYTDLSMITADQTIGEDAALFFKNIAIANLEDTYEKLLVAPNGLKPHLMKMIDDEIAKGKRGEIFFKLNSLTERDMIDKLSEASCAGVKITLLIRGICCILPGIEGKTENIEVRSIVGRFLEHSRIYRFGEPDSCKMYISSADLMTRNLTRRVELACPVQDPALKAKLNHMIQIHMNDTAKARQMNPDGTYAMLPVKEEEIPFNSQKYFMEEYQSHRRERPQPEQKPISFWEKIKALFS